MSDTDTFIDEVTEEVRRDRLFRLMRRYGWIAALVIVAVVGGAAFTEYRKAQARNQAQALGDAIIAALADDQPSARAEALAGLDAGTPGGAAVLAFLRAGAEANAGDTDAAVASLTSVAQMADLPEIYRHIASFKALTLQADTMDPADLRQQFEALASPGAPLRLLAEEQLALVDVAAGETDAALTRLQAILQDAETGPDLQQRVTQVIVVLGGTPELRPGAQG